MARNHPVQYGIVSPCQRGAHGCKQSPAQQAFSFSPSGPQSCCSCLLQGPSSYLNSTLPNPAALHGLRPTPSPPGVFLIIRQNSSCFFGHLQGTVRTLALTLDNSWAPEIHSSLNRILFCKHSKLSLTPGPFHMLFPLPKMLFPETYAWQSPS